MLSEVLLVRNYRIKLDTLSKYRVDEISAILDQYDDYIAAGDRPSARIMRQLIDGSAQACGCHDDLIAVCCRHDPAPRSKEFNKARREFYICLDRDLDKLQSALFRR